MNDILAKACLGLMALSCFCSFIWSILRFFRKQDRMPRRMKMISTTGLVCMLAQIFGIVTEASSEPIRLTLSSAFYLLAFVIFWWSLRTIWTRRLNIAFSEEGPDRLVCVGPYRAVRHPIYTSYLLAWCAGAIAIPRLWPWGAVIVMGGQYLLAIKHEEEQFSKSPMAQQYRQFVRTTGMLIPNPIKLLLLWRTTRVWRPSKFT